MSSMTRFCEMWTHTALRTRTPLLSLTSSCICAMVKNPPYQPTSHNQGTSNFTKASKDHKQEYIQLILLPHLIRQKLKKEHTHQINCHRSQQHVVPGDQRMRPPMDSTPTEHATQVPRTTNILLDGCNSNRIF
jgi:hypothetical protein